MVDKSNLKYCGENVIISPNVRIRKPEETIIHNNVIIDDYSYFSCPMEIGAYSHLSSHLNISGGAGCFKLGQFSTLASHCSVHTCSSDYRSISLDLPSVPEEHRFGGEESTIEIGDFVTVGSHSVILPFVKIPNYAAFGAFSLIRNMEYIKAALYAGTPAKYLKQRDLRAFRIYLMSSTLE